MGKISPPYSPIKTFYSIYWVAINPTPLNPIALSPEIHGITGGKYWPFLYLVYSDKLIFVIELTLAVLCYSKIAVFVT